MSTTGGAAGFGDYVSSAWDYAQSLYNYATSTDDDIANSNNEAVVPAALPPQTQAAQPLRVAGFHVDTPFKRIVDDTNGLHSAVESALFHKKVMSESLEDPAPLVQYLADLHHFFAEVSAGGALAKYPMAAQFEKDIEMLRHRLFADAAAISPKHLPRASQHAVDYAAHVKVLPPKLADTHIYTQFVALLFGGGMERQKIQNMLEGRWRMPTVTFRSFTFPGIKQLRPKIMRAYDAHLTADQANYRDHYNERVMAFLYAGRIVHSAMPGCTLDMLELEKTWIPPLYQKPVVVEEPNVAGPELQQPVPVVPALHMATLQQLTKSTQEKPEE